MIGWKLQRDLKHFSFRKDPPMSKSNNTVRLHRVMRTSPEKLYRAFLDPDAMVKWLPPHGFTGKVHKMNNQYRFLAGRISFPKIPWSIKEEKWGQGGVQLDHLQSRRCTSAVQT